MHSPRPRGQQTPRSSHPFLSFTWIHLPALCHDNRTQFDWPLKCNGSHVFDKIKQIRKTQPLSEAPCKRNIPRLQITGQISPRRRCSPLFHFAWRQLCPVLWCKAVCERSPPLLLKDMKRNWWCNINRNQPPVVLEGHWNHTHVLPLTCCLCPQTATLQSNTRALHFAFHPHRWTLQNILHDRSLNCYNWPFANVPIERIEYI